MDDSRIAQRLRTTRAAAAPPEPALERLLQRRDRKRRSARIASALTALVVATGAVVGAALAFGLHGTGTEAPQFPATRPVPADLVAGPGQFYYWKRVHLVPGGNVVEEVWWGEDGSGRYEVDSTNPNYGTPKSQTWGPDGPAEGTLPFEVEASGLSTDPSELMQQLLERSSPDGASPEPAVTLTPGLSPDTSRLWRTVQNLIEQVNVPAPLQAAIFDMTSGLPGVEKQAGVVDPVGRPAVSLSVHLGDYYCGGVDDMYFDPETHLLLATDGDLGCSPATVIVSGGIVDSRSEVPEGDQRIVPEPQQPVPEPSPVPSETA
jgi:hypothetical protein